MATLAAERVAEVIRVELARQGRTQADLARYIYGEYDGNIANRISRRLRGVICFSTHERRAAAKFLGMKPGELLARARAVRQDVA